MDFPELNGKPMGTGCYVDNHNGQYAPAIALGVARDLGAPIEPHAFRAAFLKCAEQTYPSYYAFSRTQSANRTELRESMEDEIEWAYERAEMWLNDHTEGGYWGFEDGMFGLWQFEEDE